MRHLLIGLLLAVALGLVLSVVEGETDAIPDWMAPPASAHVNRVDLPNAWTPPCPDPEDYHHCDIWHGHGHRDVLDDGTKGEDHLFGHGGNDKLIGLRAPDHIRGGPGHDRLFGNSGHDHMWGGRGNDVIDCGSGGGNPTDVAVGGPGADLFLNCEYIGDFGRGNDSAGGTLEPRLARH